MLYEVRFKSTYLYTVPDVLYLTKEYSVTYNGQPVPLMGGTGSLVVTGVHQ